MSAIALQILERPEQAEVLFHPVRMRLLELLEQPGSAASVAEAAGVPRQHAHYHLRELERVGLVKLVCERKRGNVTERTLQAAASYVVDPAAMGRLSPDPRLIVDRFSLGYLVALAQRIVREASELLRRVGPQQHVPSLTLETEITFSGPDARAAFAREIAQEAARLAEKYHDPSAGESEAYRLVIAAHPIPADASTSAPDHHERKKP